MKTIEVTVADATYADFLRAARDQRRPLADLLRDALEAYRPQLVGPGRDLTAWSPVSVGRVHHPLAMGEDVLAEVGERSRA